jgi:Ca2+-binding EF-hand superfamily protein
MAPNLTEEQTLIKYFKYFDLDNSGYCAIRDFIKTVEKIGVIIPKTNDLQRLFSHYDSENKGSINYKQLSNSLFSNKPKSTSSNNSKQGVKE